MAATSQDGPELHPATVAMAEGRNFGSMATVMPDGSLQNHLIWVGTDGERLVVNTETHRQKYENVRQDQRITLTIRAEDNPYRYAEVRGRVVETVTGQVAREHIDELAYRYIDKPYPPEDIKSERVMLWIVPERQTIIDQTASEIVAYPEG
jgi:PPOX class probable F420-dependent enzyme